MNLEFLFIASACVGFATIAGLAQLSAPEQAAVEAYRSAISAAESGRAPRAIEAAFSALGTMRDALMRSRGTSTRDGRPLELLPAQEFQTLKQRLPGAIIYREEMVAVAKVALLRSTMPPPQ